MRPSVRDDTDDTVSETVALLSLTGPLHAQRAIVISRRTVVASSSLPTNQFHRPSLIRAETRRDRSRFALNSTGKTRSTGERDALGIVNACSTCHLLGRFIVHAARTSVLPFSTGKRPRSLSSPGIFRAVTGLHPACRYVTERFVEFIIDLHANRFNIPYRAHDSRD